MSIRVNIPHLEQLVTRQLRVYENDRRRYRRPHAAAAPGVMSLSIEREAGSGAGRLARRLARRLGWNLTRLDDPRWDCLLLSATPDQAVPGDFGLRIRLVGSLESRAARVSQRLGWSQERAREWLSHEVDSPEMEDPHKYDLVLNRDRMPLDAAEKAILALVEARRP